MIPSLMEALILALGTYRIARLIGWDDFPPVARVRAWVVGEVISSAGSINDRMRVTGNVPDVTVVYRRPVLEHFIGCPFCQGFWLSVVVYAGWLLSAHVALLVLAPWALSGAVGLIAKNLDA